MMTANYHTHTPRCRHAVGMEQEYIDQAIRSGLKVLGFSDHTPYLFPTGYYSDFRMYPQELEEYCQRILALKERYHDQLEIHLGLEVEYYPALFPALIDMLKSSPIAYLLLGQHFLGNEFDDVAAKYPTDDISVLDRYCGQVIEGIQTGLFTYVAHPDLLFFTGNAHIYQSKMRRLCRAAKAADLPLEINLLGVQEKRNYPNPLFWRIAAEEGCRVIFGCDAHRPEQIGAASVLRQAEALAQHYGLQAVQTVALRKPF